MGGFRMPEDFAVIEGMVYKVVVSHGDGGATHILMPLDVYGAEESKDLPTLYARASTGPTTEAAAA